MGAVAQERHTVVPRLKAGSQWVNSGFVFTTELGEPCDPRNALRAMKAAAKRAGLPGSVGLHTAAFSGEHHAGRQRSAQGDLGGRLALVDLHHDGHLRAPEAGSIATGMRTLSNALVG